MALLMANDKIDNISLKVGQGYTLSISQVPFANVDGKYLSVALIGDKSEWVPTHLWTPNTVEKYLSRDNGDTLEHVNWRDLPAIIDNVAKFIETVSFVRGA